VQIGERLVRRIKGCSERKIRIGNKKIKESCCILDRGQMEGGEGVVESNGGQRDQDQGCEWSV